MRKSKIKTCEFATIIDSIKTSKENLNKQDNISVYNTNKQIFEMLLKYGITIKSLVTLTIYNWQSSDSNKCLAYPTVFHIA